MTTGRGPDGALGPYLRAIAAHKLVVVALACLAVWAAVLWLAVRSPEYEATSAILVTPVAQTDPTFLGLPVLRDTGDPARTIQTAATVLRTRDAAARVAARLGEPWTAIRVLQAVEIQARGESNVLGVTARAGSPQTALDLANAFASSTLAVRRGQLEGAVAKLLPQLRAQQAELGDVTSQAASDLASRVSQLEAIREASDPSLALLEPANPPARALGSSASLVLPLALLAGIALGCGAALLLELTSTRLRDEEEAIDLYPLPVLARVPTLRRSLRRRTTMGESLAPEIQEAFRSVFVELNEYDEADAGRTILVTSASRGDGKTMSAVALAAATAATGKRVLLLDLDTRQPEVLASLGMGAQPSLVALLEQRVFIGDVMAPVPELPGVFVLVGRAGNDVPPILDGFGMTLLRLPELLREATRHADFVVIDTAAVGEVSDALPVAYDVDHVLVVARPGNTSRSSFEVLRDRLVRAGVRPSGLLLIGEGQPAPRERARRRLPSENGADAAEHLRGSVHR